MRKYFMCIGAALQLLYSVVLRRSFFVYIGRLTKDGDGYAVRSKIWSDVTPNDMEALISTFIGIAKREEAAGNGAIMDTLLETVASGDYSQKGRFEMTKMYSERETKKGKRT
jgi:hypothetical protein